MENVHIILGAPKEEAIKPLIQAKGIVIGVDRGALLALEEHIEVDLALGDFDSITQEEKDFIRAGAKEMLSFPSDKDDTDAELALLYVLEHYPEATVYLYNWYGGRIDHLYSILLLAVQKRFNAIVPNLNYVSVSNVISYFLSGEHEITQISRMTYLSFITLTETENLTLNKVRYPLENHSFKRPIALISNEFIGSNAHFSFTEGIVAVVQSRDDEKEIEV